MTNNDRKYVREEALDALRCLSHIGLGYYPSYPSRAVQKWNDTDRPILTDRTKAILEEVEEAMKKCKTCIIREKCFYRASVSPNSNLNYICPLAGIRRAYEKGMKYER